ncbi:unnamed protein product [Polarella glacialis]|uniref:Uncharacterized protein n=1 Tax=Polarella glacialis TaxID=89957 RepID=A0A813LSJ5_POLGL|nr:unnamed protein product [Polarella glacialis]
MLFGLARHVRAISTSSQAKCGCRVPERPPVASLAASSEPGFLRSSCKYVNKVVRRKYGTPAQRHTEKVQKGAAPWHSRQYLGRKCMPLLSNVQAFASGGKPKNLHPARKFFV